MKFDMDEYQKLLAEFVSIKSISTDDQFRPEIDKTVSWLVNLFKTNGFQTEIYKGSNSNPVVFANYIHVQNKKTVLIYGHYDVQPAKKEDGWESDPFQLNEKNNRLFGRGVVDNKGQILIHIYSILELIKDKKLKYNVKFLIEGNEETSNEDIEEIIKSKRDKLSCDYVLISDGEIIGDHPTVETSLRGGGNITIKYKTAQTNVHSGIFGGAAPNAATEIITLLAKLLDHHGVKIENFNSEVDKVDEKQIESLKSLSQIAPDPIENTGMKRLLINEKHEFYIKTGLLPTIQITSLKSGYMDSGYANIVPNTAEVKLNLRTVESQDTKKVIAAIKQFVIKTTPDYVSVEISHTPGYPPIKLNTNTQIYNQIRLLLKDIYLKEVLSRPVGGGIPIVTVFKEVLNRDSILVSLANSDCNMHGVDENFKLDLIEKGIEFSLKFFSTPQ